MPPPIARLTISGCTGIVDSSPIAGLVKTLRALDMRGFKNGYPDFMDKAAMGGVVRMVC